jgi:hypothetical protein
MRLFSWSTWGVTHHHNHHYRVEPFTVKNYFTFVYFLINILFWIFQWDNENVEFPFFSKNNFFYNDFFFFLIIQIMKVFISSLTSLESELIKINKNIFFFNFFSFSLRKKEEITYENQRDAKEGAIFFLKKKLPYNLN